MTRTDALLAIGVALLAACDATTTTTPHPQAIEPATAPSVSSNSSRLSARERSSRMSFDSSGSCGSVSRPFQAQPTT